MKKVLLSSVAALAVFTAAAPVFADNTGQHNSADDNATSLTGADVFTGDEYGLTQYGKDGLNNVDAESTKDKFKAAGETVEPKLDENGKAIPGEFVVKDAPKADAKADVKADKKADAKDAKKAAAAAGQKALPKTSAVK